MEIAALVATGVILSSIYWMPSPKRATQNDIRVESLESCPEKELQSFSMKELQRDIETLSKV